MSVLPGHHNLAVYGDDQEGLIVVMDRSKWTLLEESFGAARERIAFEDRDRFHTRPEDALCAYDARVRRLVADGFSAVRIWTELPASETRRDARAWVVHEAILNRALTHHPVTIVCGYDAREHRADMVDGARRTHPVALEDTWHENPRYGDPEQVVRALVPTAEPLPCTGAVPARCASAASRGTSCASSATTAADLRIRLPAISRRVSAAAAGRGYGSLDS